MAQKITRTITTTLVTCKVIHAENEEVFNTVVTLPGNVEKEDKICKECTKEVAQKGYVFLKVLDIQHVDALYEMPLDVFIANATRVTE